MHILLTDLATCPRCGPEFGLILLVDEMRERRVQRGALGCANCRERYPIEGGTGDFTLGQSLDFGDSMAADAAVRLVALAGVTTPPAQLLIAGPAAAHAAALSHMVPDVELIVAFGAADGEPAAGGGGMSRMRVGDRLPLRSGRMQGVILSGGSASLLLEEGARVLSHTGRLVLEPAPADARRRLGDAGLQVLAEQGATMVAVRS